MKLAARVDILRYSSLMPALSTALKQTPWILESSVLGGLHDPLHPFIDVFFGRVDELKVRLGTDECVPYRTFHIYLSESGDPLEDRVALAHQRVDPTPSIYVYAFSSGNMYSLDEPHKECVYIGITRNPTIRFRQHRKKHWWLRVTHVHIARIDCRYHGGEICSAQALDAVAKAHESWLIDTIEPAENLILGRV